MPLLSLLLWIFLIMVSYASTYTTLGSFVKNHTIVLVLSAVFASLIGLLVAFFGLPDVIPALTK